MNKEKYRRNFKGLWIPAEILESKKLTLQEKLFLAEIDSFDREEGCSANNNYFADFFQLSKKRCSIIISKLIKMEYITSHFVYYNNAITSRVMKMTQLITQEEIVVSYEVDKFGNKRKFKGLWIPAEIWESTELTLQEKVFLAEIDSLDNREGCSKGNEYFANLFQLSKNRVSVIISKLVAKGYVENIYNQKTGQERVLHTLYYIDKKNGKLMRGSEL